jgi:YidC/Oxa1 family membrane protein insertase
MWSFLDPILSQPILNFLVILYDGLFSNLGLAIIALTLIIRLVLLPLTIKQLRASKTMSEKMRDLQPKLQALQKKYAKDKQKLGQEMMNLYKEEGISPLGCLASPMLLLMLIQMPIWIGLYRAIMLSYSDELMSYLYSWAIPLVGEGLDHQFLWLNLAERDPYFLIPLLVVATMWLSQKMVTIPSGDPKQQSMTNMMTLMMPLMFGIICFTLPSGLSLYWVISSLISIAIQYPIYGWRKAPALPLLKEVPNKGASNPGKHEADIPIPEQTLNSEEKTKHGKPRSKRKNRRRSNPESPGATGTSTG